ncbi:MAG: hypothetical protein P8017_19225 [Deltaproteobacteria bacterium]
MARGDASRKTATPKSFVRHIVTSFLEYNFISYDEETKKYLFIQVEIFQNVFYAGKRFIIRYQTAKVL